MTTLLHKLGRMSSLATDGRVKKVNKKGFQIILRILSDPVIIYSKFLNFHIFASVAEFCDNSIFLILIDSNPSGFLQGKKKPHNTHTKKHIMAEFRMILYQYVTTGIGVLVAVFNSLMIVYIRYANIYKSNPIGYVYITNMAVTDLLVGLTMVSLKSMHPHIDTKFTGPPFAQELYHILRFCLLRFSLLTSVLNLTALTLDRFCAIRFPFLVARLNKRFHVKICIWIWMVSFVITSAFYAITRFHFQNMEKYKDTLFPIATFPATVLFVMCYGYIFRVVSSSSNAINQKNVSLRQNQTNSRDKQSSTQKEKVK